MDGLRSTRRLSAGMVSLFCIFLSLFFAPPLRGEEPFPSGDTETPAPETLEGEQSPETQNPGDPVQAETVPALDVEALRRGITGEAPGELVNLSLGDSSVSLRIAGRWKGTLQGGWGLALTPFGVSALAGDVPLFAQEGDLTLSLWVRNRWFVEASFLDDSNLNTYRAGYQGRDGEAVRYLGIGNTGLDFPVFPYLDLGGDSPSSFGAYGHFGAGNLAFHSLVRYDSAAREERVFVGDRERNYAFVSPARPERGTSFVLPIPQGGLGAVPEIYIEDNKGPLVDDSGRHWRLAEASEYGAGASYGLVELTLGTYTDGASSPGGMIAVYYPEGYTSMGTYAGPPGTFLGDVQDHFDPDRNDVRLWDYPQPGGRNQGAPGGPGNVPGTVFFSGKEALVIYEPGTFSPFEKQNRYLSPANTSSSAALVKLSSGETLPDYEVIPLEDGVLQAAISAGEQSAAMRGIYELVREGSGDRRSPEERWPLGAEYPELYLPGRTVFTGDLGIRFTSYSAAGAYNIGNDVVPGSVQVYRNGILDPRFSYNSSGGTVSLETPAGFNEVIRVSYLKQSGERRLGSLAAGIGAVWDPGGVFSGKLGLGLRWNTASGAYSESGAGSPGTVGLGAEAKWDLERLKAGLSFGLGYEQPDTTGLYRAAGMEGSEIILSLPPATSFISEIPGTNPPDYYPLPSYTLDKRAELVYRNYRDTSALGTVSLDDINSDASVVSGESGPYPAMDKTLSSQVLAAEFDLSSEKTWTGFETPLGTNGEFLEKAGKIEVPYRFADFSGTPEGTDITVFLQIGALADENTGNTEHPDLQINLQLYPPAALQTWNPSGFNTERRVAEFTITDDMRAKLQNAKYLRLLVAYSGSATVHSRVILAPPIVRGALWRPVTVIENGEISPAKSPGSSGPEVNAVEDVEDTTKYEGGTGSLENRYPDMMSRLHGENSRQRVLEISWEDFPEADSGPGADGRIPSVPLANYRFLSFFVRRPLAGTNSAKTDSEPPDPDQDTIDDSSLRFVLARGPSSLTRPEETTLDAVIPLRAFKENGVGPGKWTKVEIHYRGGEEKILVEGKPAAGSRVVYRSAVQTSAAGISVIGGGSEDLYNQGSGNSSYAAILLVPESGALPFPAGNFAADEIILEEPVPSYRLNAGASLEWALPGPLLSLGNRALLSDISFQAALETGAQGNPFEGGSAKAAPGGSFGMNGRTRAGFSLLGFRLTGNYSYSFNNVPGQEPGYTWAAGHSVSRSFGPFSVSESFDSAPSDRTMNHRAGLSLNTGIGGNISGEAVLENEKLRRRWQAGAGGRPGELPLNFYLETSAALNEKKTGEEAPANYAGEWIESFGDLVPDFGADAESRDLRGSFRFRLDTSPLGAEFYFLGSSAFSTLRENSGVSSLARLDFPIAPRDSGLRLLFRAEREYRKDLPGNSGDFRDDGKNWAESFGGALPLLFSVPLYSLFDPRAGGRMDEFAFLSGDGNGTALYAGGSQFADRFEFSFQRGMNYGVSSLFIPGRFSFRLSRILERKLDTPRDTLSLGAVLGFSQVNMFGAMGAASLFDFYRGDEFSHTLETQVSFPRGEALTWTVRAEQGMFFYGFSGAELSVNNTLTVNSPTRTGEGSRWTDSLGAAWTVPMNTTLLGTVYAFFARMARGQSSWLTLANLAESEYELERKESLEFVFERVPDASRGDYNRFSLTAGHESIVRIFGRLNLSVFAKLKISEDYNTRVLSFLGTVGTTLNLMF